jgi:hypothetical protein
MSTDTNLDATTTVVGNRLDTWFDAFKQQGYSLKPAIIITLIMGMYLHVTSLFIGRELLIRYVLTPSFDAVLAVPMTYAGIVGWLMWRRVVHPNRWHRLVYGFTIVYFTISIPIHVQTFITQHTDYILAFPWWYSYFILLVQVGMLRFVGHLRFKKSAN